jgi:hypothetical protein
VDELMPRRKATGGKPPKRPIDRYEHTDKKRINNPPVGLVTPETDPVLLAHKVYDYVQPVPTLKPGADLDYDPHLDPQLVWAGKKEHTSFEVPTVSLHVHERKTSRDYNRIRTIDNLVTNRRGELGAFEANAKRLAMKDGLSLDLTNQAIGICVGFFLHGVCGYSSG